MARSYLVSRSSANLHRRVVHADTRPLAKLRRGIAARFFITRQARESPTASGFAALCYRGNLKMAAGCLPGCASVSAWFLALCARSSIAFAIRHRIMEQGATLASVTIGLCAVGEAGRFPCRYLTIATSTAMRVCFPRRP